MAKSHGTCRTECPTATTIAAPAVPPANPLACLAASALPYKIKRSLYGKLPYAKVGEIAEVSNGNKNRTNRGPLPGRTEGFGGAGCTGQWLQPDGLSCQLSA